MPTLKLGRLEARGVNDCVRLLLGSSVLIGAASAFFAVAGSFLPRPVLNRLLRVWAKAAVRLLDIDIDVKGLEHVDPNGQYLVVALHEGFADPLALSLLGLDLRFIVRDELFDWRLLGPALRATGQIEVAPEARARGYRSLIRGAAETIRSGESLMIFPQGTLLGVETAFRPGAFNLADRFGVPVLPVVLTGASRVWDHPFENRLHFRQRISMRVLPPLRTGTANQSMRQLEREMKKVALGPEMAPVRRFVPERDGYWDRYSYEIDPDFPDLYQQVADHRSTRTEGIAPSIKSAS